jgi:hypothetical protein
MNLFFSLKNSGEELELEGVPLKSHLGNHPNFCNFDIFSLDMYNFRDGICKPIRIRASTLDHEFYSKKNKGIHIRSFRFFLQI